MLHRQAAAASLCSSSKKGKSKRIRMPIVLVEGNISAGKSTLCTHLGEELGFKLYLEPTAANPLLEKFYEDPKTWALPLQFWVLRQRYFTYIEALRASQEESRSGTPCAGVVLDRSVFSDIVFADKNHRDGNISEEGYQTYLELRKELLRALPLPDCVLYLDASPEVCHDRMQNLRKRDCEAGVPLDYLQGLDDCYHSFLLEMNLLGVHVREEPWNNFGNVSDVGGRVVAACARPERQSERLTSLDFDRLMSKLALFDEHVQADDRISSKLLSPEEVSRMEAEAEAAVDVGRIQRASSSSCSSSSESDAESDEGAVPNSGSIWSPCADAERFSEAAMPSPLELQKPLLDSVRTSKVKHTAIGEDSHRVRPLSLENLSL